MDNLFQRSVISEMLILLDLLLQDIESYYNPKSLTELQLYHTRLPQTKTTITEFQGKESESRVKVTRTQSSSRQARVGHFSTLFHVLLKPLKDLRKDLVTIGKYF